MLTFPSGGSSNLIAFCTGLSLYVFLMTLWMKGEKHLKTEWGTSYVEERGSATKGKAHNPISAVETNLN